MDTKGRRIYLLGLNLNSEAVRGRNDGLHLGDYVSVDDPSVALELLVCEAAVPDNFHLLEDGALPALARAWGR